MAGISQWSTTAGSNNATPPDGWPENMAPSGVNNAAREDMAATRTFYNTLEWREFGRKTLPTPAGDLHTTTYASATTFTTASGDNDTTGTYTKGRRIRAVGTTTTTIYGRITESSHSGSTTVTVDWDSGTFANDSDLVISLGMDPTNMPIVGAGWEVIVPTTALATESEIEVTADAGFDYRMEIYDINPSIDANLEVETFESATYLTSANDYRTMFMQTLGATVSGSADSNGNVIYSTIEATQTNAWDSLSGWLEFRQMNNANIISLVEFSFNGETSSGDHLYRHGRVRRDAAAVATKFKLLLTGGNFASNGYYVVMRRKSTI